jgi:hypothetical protein
VSAKKRSHTLAAAAGLAVAYVGLFPLPMERELVAGPAWAIETAGPAARVDSGAGAGRPRPFLSGGRVGYYDPAGGLLFSEPVLYGASIGAASFINYSRLPSSLVVKDAHGAFLEAIPARGYPLLDAAGERILLVSLDGKGLAEVDRSGDTLWRLEFASLITTLDFGNAGLLVGLLDGSFALYDRTGKVLYSLKSPASRVPAIFGCAARSDALACVAGIDPQRLIVVARNEGRFQVAVDTTLSSDFRREVLVRFAAAGHTLYFEEPGGLGLLDLRSRAVRAVPLPGSVRALAEAPASRLWAALYAGAGSGGTSSGLRIYQAPDRLVLRETLPAAADFLAGSDTGFVVGLGQRLVSVEFRRE